MSETKTKAPSDELPSMHRTVHISVEQFGPIKKGTVDLRPLTIFVGPSNTGKTYLAILIYALHKALHGFPRLPTMGRYFISMDDNPPIFNEEIKKLSGKLDDIDSAISFSDLPNEICDEVRYFLNDEDLIADDIRSEIVRCFDLDSISELIRIHRRDTKASISMSVSENESELWNFHMKIASSGITSQGMINDIVLIPSGNLEDRKKLQRAIKEIQKVSSDASGNKKSRYRDYLVGELATSLPQNFDEQQVESYFLPAARTGIMQSHRVIASSLVARSTRAGLERIPELPTLSGVMVDFLQRLILFDARDPRRRMRERRRRRAGIQELAEDLERETLLGRIHARRSSLVAYPEFVYQPFDAKQNIRLSRASSMVSELAPVVIFVRGNIGVGDTLIFEEPEAHLHPAAQTKMAVTLARLVRAGVRVVVTTHSDWLLKELGNLMREGELEDQAKAPVKQAPAPSSLRPDDVGIWLFRKDDEAKGSTVTEIEFDRIEGIEPSDYETVSEELYNRSATLQNRFEEVTKQSEPKG